MSILVFSENRNGKLKKNSFEAVSYASQIAKEKSSQVVAVSIGDVADEELSLLAKYGANKIISVTDEKFKHEDSMAYTKIIADIFDKENGEIVLFSHSNVGKAIAPRLSVKLKAGLASGVTHLPTSLSPLTVKKRTYNGAAFLNVKIKSDKKILTLNANASDIIENPVDVNI